MAMLAACIQHAANMLIEGGGGGGGGWGVYNYSICEVTMNDFSFPAVMFILIMR